MLGEMRDYQVKGNKVGFSFGKGEAFVEVLRADIVNIFVPYECREHRSKAIEIRPDEKVAFEVTKDSDAVVICTEKLIVKVYDEFYIDIYQKDGTLLCADYRGTRKMRPLLSEKSLAVLKAEGHGVSAGSGMEHKVQAGKVMD